MIKYLAGLSLILFFLASCGESTEEFGIGENGEENNFIISGNIEGADNITFFLEALSPQGTIPVTQVSSDATGKFSMKGNIPGFGLFQLRMGETTDKIIPLTLVPNDKVKLSSKLADYAIKPTLTGTDWAPVFTEYMSIASSFQQELLKLKGKVSNDELTKRYLILKKVVDSFAISSMDKYPSNAFNIILSSSAAPTMGFENWDIKNLDVLKKVADAYKETYKKSPITSALVSQVSQIEQAYKASKTVVPSEQVAPEISLKKPDGSDIRLSELRGSYVLIDFWASWCAPCRKESPNMVKLYNEYKNKGFTIFSVSLDKNSESWKAAIAQDGLIWPNHGSDFKMWDTPSRALYNFSSIPHTVLVNKEGMIIASGLRGEQLEQKLKAIFTK
jgi:thiol-disulfide isomerase/thioredoxin